MVAKKCIHDKNKYRCKECNHNILCHHQKFKSYCKECGGSAFCEHGKRKSYCRNCGGSAFCEHGRQKARCKECGGSSFCEHGKIKGRCKDCGGNQICEHGRIKSECKDCGGNQICEHGKIKGRCKDCGGSQLCEHGKIKGRCKNCGGSQLCEHGRIKSDCRKCGGNSFCEHGKIKGRCKDCGGSQICEHGKRRERCKECGGSAFCEHGRQKSYCKKCGGSSLCKSSWCETTANSKYEGYCAHCYFNLYPDKPISRNYKTKENEVINFIKTSYPDQTWITNKRFEEGCSLKLPDIRCDFGFHILIIEVDENQHKDRGLTCETKRLAQLSEDVDNRPIVCIRFNPDGYIDENGNTIKSCWSTSKETKKLNVNYTQVKKWNARLEKLKETIDYWCTPENSTGKMIEVIELFYDYIQ